MTTQLNVYGREVETLNNYPTEAAVCTPTGLLQAPYILVYPFV